MEDDLIRVTKLANDVIEAESPVYCTTLSLDDALKIPGIVFLPDEVTWLSYFSGFNRFKFLHFCQNGAGVLLF